MYICCLWFLHKPGCTLTGWMWCMSYVGSDILQGLFISGRIGRRRRIAPYNTSMQNLLDFELLFCENLLTNCVISLMETKTPKTMMWKSCVYPQTQTHRCHYIYLHHDYHHSQECTLSHSTEYLWDNLSLKCEIISMHLTTSVEWFFFSWPSVPLFFAEIKLSHCDVLHFDDHTIYISEIFCIM